MFTLSFDSALKTRSVTRSMRRRAWRLAAVTLVPGLGAPAHGQVITYEGNVFPETLSWQRLPAGANEGQRTLGDGWFIQTLQEHDQDYYRYNIGSMTSLTGRFFVEWRAVTDNPEWLIDEWQVPTVVVAGGNGPGFYHVVMTESAAVLYRDINIPWVVVPFSIDEPHTYRVDVFADQYVWYIDGVVVDHGLPEGPYPDPTARLSWGAEVTHEDAPPATAAWDFVRVGKIPDDASGDYDSDGVDTLFDLYFFDDCLTKDGPGIFGGPDQSAGPGCRFADFDADGDTDLLDFAEFQNVFNGQ